MQRPGGRRGLGELCCCHLVLEGFPLLSAPLTFVSFQSEFKALSSPRSTHHVCSPRLGLLALVNAGALSCITAAPLSGALLCTAGSQQLPGLYPAAPSPVETAPCPLSGVGGLSLLESSAFPESKSLRFAATACTSI